VGVGDVGSHQSDPVQRIHPSDQTLRGPVLDLSVVSLVLESSAGETGPQDIGPSTFS
jgi:hypothetical protein